MTVFYSYMDWTVENAGEADCLAVARGLRPDDAREVYAFYGAGTERAVLDSAGRSEVCFCVKRSGCAVMVFGVAPRALLGGEFAVWALARSEIELAPTAFLRHCRRAAERLNEVFPVMMNFVGVWNVRSLRWLRWCGFSVLPARRIGLHGEWFYPVERRRR